MAEYVVGLAFDEPQAHVLLIRKTKPARQLGYLNGIGGKIEDGESPSEAMAREFEEESGLTTDEKTWQPLVVLGPDHGPQGPWKVWFFYALGVDIAAARTQGEEEIVVVHVEPVITGLLPVLMNLTWIVALALDDTTHKPLAACEWGA